MYKRQAAFGIGCSVQSNAIADALVTNFNFNASLVGLILAAVTFLVIFGGVKSIANVCEKLVPFMSLFYTLGCFYILYYNRAYLLPAIELIVQAAFTPRAMAGGFIGSTIITACRYGCARGLFSVSYTHLVTESTLIKISADFSIVCIRPNVSSKSVPEPVSYTHLDVYKRQCPSPRSASRSASWRNITVSVSLSG